MNKNKKLLLIINPNAGIRKRENSLSEILLFYSENNYETTVCFTTKKGDATELVKNHSADEFDLLVCVGGDGTLNETLAGVLQSGWTKPVGYIPAGSTNDFASSLGLPSDAVEAAHRSIYGKLHPVDLGEFNGKPFVYTASSGIFSNASYETPQKIKNKLGHFAYILEGMKNLMPQNGGVKPIPMKIDTGDQVYEGEYIFAAICNTYSLGGVMSLDENDVSLSDGMFEMLLIKMPEDLMVLSSIISSLYEQTYDNPNIIMAKVRKASIYYESEQDWSLDGERGRTKKMNEFKVLHNAVTLMC